MFRSKWVSIIFLVAFAISLAHTITPHSHPKTKSVHTHASQHNHDENKSHSHSASDLPVFAHFSNSDFISSSSQVNLGGPENLSGDLIISVPIFLLSVPFVSKLSFPAGKQGRPPSGPLLSVLSLRAPPVL